ncbi:MAG: autotransporter domain-containing protein [Planctomycetaceae bacterium]|jgi:autotransporter-associated beta strand protein/predicted outer membrane repeat protein|nr:autotransporter domain-containing protein [Planctomycetaceae bacterium]
MKKNTAVSRTRTIRRNQLAAGALAVILAMFPWVADKPAFGQTIELDADGIPTTYLSLEELRTTIPGAFGAVNVLTLSDGFTADTSLTHSLNIDDLDTSLLGDGASLTIKKSSGTAGVIRGDGTLSGGGTFSFIGRADNSPPSGTALTLDSVSIEQFGVSAVVVNNGTLNITGGTTDAAKAQFLRNTGIYGAAVNVRNTALDVRNTRFGSAGGGNTAVNDGGAVQIDGRTANFDNVSFIGNKTSNGHGGAIYSQYADVVIGYAQFDGNIAGPQTGIGWESNGGAIAVASGTLTFNTAANKTGFINNKAEYRGGAIWVYDDVQLNITNAVFGTSTTNGNQATQGGAVFIEGSIGNTHTIDNITFQSNKAVGNSSVSGKDVYGGAVALSGGDTLEILGGKFLANSAAATGTITAADGGAIAVVNGGILNVSKNGQLQTSFEDNTATGNGGAVAVKSDDPASGAITATFTDAVFKQNTADGFGGAISAVNISGNNVKVIVEANGNNVAFIDNFDGTGANDIYLDGAELELKAGTGRKIDINGGLVSNAQVAKTGTGAANINAASTAGNVSVDAGQLGIYADTTAESVIVGNAGNKATLAIGGISDPAAGADGEGKTLTVAGKTELGPNGVLSVGLYDDYLVPSEEDGTGVTKAAIVTGGFEAQIGSVININSFGKYNSVDPTSDDVPVYTLVKSDTDIDKNGKYQFDVAGVNAQQGNSFLKIGEYITGDNKKMIQVGAGLRWNSQDTASANGTFCVEGAGTVFELYTGLRDNTDNASWTDDAPMNNYAKWDGKSLWKDCDGTLVLLGENTYTGGTTVVKGTLVAASVVGGNIAAVGVNPGDAGYTAQSIIDIRSGAVFEIGNYGINGAADSITGTLGKEVKSDTGGKFIVNAGPTGTITIDRANTNLLGSIEIASGTGKITNLNAFGNNIANRTVTVDKNAKFDIAAGGTYNQKITGAGSLVKSGAADLTINRGNDYTGGTNIAGGTLIAADNEALGIGDVGLNGGNLKLTDGGSESSIPVFGNNINGIGNVNIELAAGTDWISLGGSKSDYTGTTSVIRGNLELTDVNATGKNGTVNINGAGQVLRFNIADGGTETYTNAITGAGSVEKTGSGRIELNKANNYTGETTVKDGTLAAGNKDAAGAGTTIYTQNNGTFEVAYGGDFTKTVVGTGSFAVNSGEGKRTVIKSENTYTGDTLLKSGTAVVNTLTALGENTSDRTVQFTGGGLEFNISGDGAFHQKLSGDTGTVVKVNNNVLTLDGKSGNFKGDVIVKDGGLIARSVSSGTIDALGTGGLVIEKNGLVTLDLGGELKNTVSGSGKLIVDVGSKNTATFSGDNTDFGGIADVQSGTMKITNLNGAGTNDNSIGSVELSADTFLDIAAGESGAFNKKINGAGSLIKSGSSRVELSYPNTYSGTTTVKGGTLAVKNEDALGSDGAVTVQTPGTLEIAYGDADGTDFNKLIQGDGNVAVNPGAGNKVIFDKENIYSGKTSVETGSLVLENLKGTGTTKEAAVADGAALELEANGTYDRKITGDGKLVIGEARTVELTGTNSHLNTIVEEDARLDIGSSTALGREATTLKDGASLGFTQSVEVKNSIVLEGLGKANIDTRTFDSAISGDISGDAGLVKLGTGSLTLTGDNAFSGGLDVNKGRVIVDKVDALGTGAVKTAKDAELELNIKGRETLRSGIDTTQGTLIKSGTGQLDFTDKYVTGKMEAVDGSIGVQLGKAFIKATNGFIAGPDAKIVGLYQGADGLERGSDNATKFLALDGAGSSNFSKYGFISDLDHVQWATAQEGNQLYYLLWLGSFADAYADSLSPNAQEAAKGADGLPLTDDLAKVLNGLTNRNDVIDAFNTLHGEIYAVSTYAVADIQRGFNERLLDRRLLCEHCREFKSFRGQERSGANGGVNRELWATFTGGGNFRSKFDKFSGYSIGRWGVLGGLEQEYAKGFFTGVALGYDQADLELKQLPMEDQFYAVHLAAYFNYTIQDWSVLGYTGYSKNWHDVRREVDLVGAKANNKFDDDVFTMGFELGKLYHWNNVNLMPVVGVDYIHVTTPYTAEKNAGIANLVVHRNRYTSFRIPIGVKSSSEFDVQGVKFRPELRAYFLPDFGNTGVYGRTAFASAPSNTFIMDSGARTRGGVRLGVGMQARLTDFINVGFDYDAEFWERYARHDLGGNISLRW